MRKFELNLNNEPFLSIKSGLKTVEMRLYDEKRKLLKKGDLINFINRETGELLLTEIVDLKRFNNFEELYKNYDKIVLGYKENQEAKPEDMLEYYSKEKQSQYGVLAIEIKLV